MEIINFLSRNSYRVYKFFDEGYDRVQDYWENLHWSLSFFLRITLPFILNPIINAGSQIIFLIYNMMSQLMDLSFSLYYSLQNYVYNLAGQVTFLSLFIFNQLTDLATGLYFQLSFIVRNLFSALLLVIQGMISQLIFLMFDMFGRLTAYVTFLFDKLMVLGNYWFEVIGGFINSGAIGFLMMLMQRASSLMNLIDLPLNLLNYLLGTVTQLVNTLFGLGISKLFFMMQEGYNIITTLTPLLGNLMQLIIPQNFMDLMSLLVSFKNGLPEYKDSFYDYIRIKLEDTILDIIERALERFF